MSHSAGEVVVGGVVLAGALAFGLYTVQVTGLEFGGAGDGYQLSASFRSAEGVGVGTDVRLAGVKIGSVSGVALDPETYRAETTVTIRDGIEIPDDSAIVVASEGLLGGSFVEINPGGSPFYYGPGDQIQDTQGAVSLISLLMKFVGGEGGS
ncbi:outer membrane lipid asymmetry maintenance protein MlaD [Allosediminivita pacifica]|uniref:Phospholipid/cholesterol/gamma-HCH transport system substrate-binding protein n=1 Tax=Allosediminivita pacifica TaxID=1267769 RepID=A0A2T6ABG4_9RHOB|nr:outer membrane lipid asymmetry maintenance protein MlaD [Allosediminivita pacifica]PTX41166.1 phospholipid/cholesterol/gamma-HCH transport system substrate-binding protein [Allosediminivita pacifica]GGB24769.1 outer membrane lipid asymmetry maintenance protein MlaD [Allosediminivita pacifica]